MFRSRPFLLGAAFLVFVAPSAFLWTAYQPFYVPSASMLPTLLPGDSVVVRRIFPGCPRVLAQACRLMEPPLRSGDIIVFRSGGQFLVKRLIGLPSDEVAMRGSLLLVNGAPVEKRRVTDYAYDRADGETLRITRFLETLPNGVRHATLYGYRPTPPLPAPDLDDTPPMSTPPAHYFVMGDDRDRSYDSRMSREDGGTGMVPEAEVVGVVRLVLFSVRPAPESRSFLSAMKALRWDRLLHNVDDPTAQE